MPLTGLAEIIFAVDDVVHCTGFLEDFGLTVLEASSTGSLLEVLSGQRVRVYRLGDPRVPASDLAGPGVHEAIWACPDEADLESLVADLSRDHAISRDADGTAHFVTGFGQAIGLRLFRPPPIAAPTSPTNTPGIVNRLNLPRKWMDRAIPKTISHVVWGQTDVDKALDFYTTRLGFRLTDMQKGVGCYIRCGRSTNHHNIALASADLTHFGFSGKFQFHHVNFGVTDIDEIMAGKNYLERRGRDTSGMGLGRHRISSELFLYLKSPAGGEIEYGADCDQVDEHWRPRLWGANFAAFAWVHNQPEFLKAAEPDWDVGYVTPETTWRQA
ncbi:MAG TPA: VOC family protein [Novosphingobium sp.]|nr:VOC family protein [Novosphingobium sp.]